MPVRVGDDWDVRVNYGAEKQSAFKKWTYISIRGRLRDAGERCLTRTCHNDKTLTSTYTEGQITDT
jgi:hypothetical protein